jgi:hypothetical protein
MSTYTIGQVAARTGFSASTLRFYEHHGLLEPAGRTAAGYRLYDDTSLARLAFIDRAKQLGAPSRRSPRSRRCGNPATAAHLLGNLRLPRGPARDRVRAGIGGARTARRSGRGLHLDRRRDPRSPGRVAVPARARRAPGTNLGRRVATRVRRDGGTRRPARLAAAEQACCAFFAFAITIDQRGIALEVRAPAAAEEAVTAVFGAAA